MPQIIPALVAGGAALVGAASTGLAGLFSFLSGGSMLSGILKIGFSMAAQYVLGQLFAPKPKAQTSKLRTDYGTQQPRQVILGRVGIAGHHVFRNARGSGNRRVADVFRLSDFRISAIPRVKGEGQWRTLATDVDTILSGDVTIRKHYGTDTVADAWLVANSGTRWKSTSVGLGIAYAIAETRMTIEGLTAPWDPLFEVIGPNLYDWRSDDTVGGDGGDRWNDPDTWTGDPENPVLQMYLLERGVFVDGSLICGKGVSASRLPLAEWTVAANICDEEVGPDFVPRYRSSLIAISGRGSTHDSNMQPLLEACAASWIDDASGEFPIVGAPQAVVATFTDDDLVVGEPLRFSAKRRRVELVNTVAGAYTEPDVFYEEKDLATRIDAGALTEDGETLAVSLPFSAVTYSEQGDRLADIQIRASRYQANAEVVLRPKFLALKPGRWVTWDSARYGERTFLVVSKRLGALDTRGPRNVSLVLQEIADGVFDPTEYSSVPTEPLPPGEPDYQSELSGFLAQPFILTSEGTGEKPAIKTSWDAITDTTITGIQFEYWPVAQPLNVIQDSVTADFEVKYLTVGVISSTQYEGRYRLISNPARPNPWVDWGPVTTPAASEVDVTVKLSNLSAGLKATLAQQVAQLALVTAKMQQLAAAVTEEVRQSSDSKVVIAKTQDAQAVAMQILSASVATFEDSIIANAEAITALNATVGDTGAGALWRMTVEAGTGDVISRIVLQVRATVGDDFVDAATIWEAGFVGGNPLEPFGRIILDALQTMISVEGNVVALFDEDGVHFSNVFIANLTGDQIEFNTLTGDHIVALSIDSPSLAFESVTEYGDLSYNETRNNDDGDSFDTGLTKVVEITVDNPAGNPLILFIDLEARHFNGSGTGGAASVIALRKNDATPPLAFAQRTGLSNGTTQAADNGTMFINEGETAPTFQIYRQFQGGFGGSSQVDQEVTSASGVLWWKR